MRGIRFYENRMADGSNWLQLRLQGTGAINGSATGARVEVTANGTTQTEVVDGGHGHFGMQRDPVLHFGPGEACEVDVQVFWPDAGGSVQSFTLSGNQRYDITLGETPSSW